MKFTKSPLAVIFLVVFIDLVGFGIIIPLGPYFATYVGAEPFEVGLLMTAFSLMQFLFNPFWGGLSDKYGRRPILLISLLGASFSYLIFAFSQSYTQLLIARALAGFFGANISTAMAYVADITESKDRSKSMGLIGAALGLGFIFGPAIGGFLSQVGFKLGDIPPFGIGFSALIASLICFVNFLWAFKVLKESLPPEKRTQPQAKPSRAVLAKKYLNVPTLGALIFMAFVSTYALAHMESTLALYVQDLWGWGVSQASFAFAYIGVIIVFTQGFLIRKLMPKFGEPPIMFSGLVMCSLGFYLIAHATTIPIMIVAVTFIGLGSGLFNPSNLGSISLLSSSEEQGLVMGVAQSFSSLGRILGPISGGWLYGAYGKESPFYVAALVIALGFFVLLSVKKGMPNSQKGRK